MSLLLLLAAAIVVGIPAYVVGVRTRVLAPGLAFIPYVGPWIVILHSIGWSAWWAILAFVPPVNLFFYAVLAFVIPAEHGRTRWWALPLLVPIVNLVAFYAYAFTFPRTDPEPKLAELPDS